jgi:CheY-like chemotaxis protein
LADGEALRRLLKQHLEGIGYAGVLAESGQEALAVLHQVPRALALSDYKPPDSLVVVDTPLRRQPSLRFIILTLNVHS